MDEWGMPGIQAAMLGAPCCGMLCSSRHCPNPTQAWNDQASSCKLAQKQL